MKTCPAVNRQLVDFSSTIWLIFSSTWSEGGFGDPEQPEGPWIPVGVGIHTGYAFVGKVGQAGVTDITVLGDSANVAARLSSAARTGEILASEAAVAAAHLAANPGEMRMLELKGRSEAMQVWVQRIAPGIAPAAHPSAPASRR